ncbi:MAG: hypothetical protein IPJ65_33605 [Archangiaceae bacterium]|nr:hypothetical protein [Archangiaceae bacterium]
MKITLEKNGAVTIRFDGTLGFRQAFGLPKLINLFPNRAKVKLDFTHASWESDAAAAAVIPAVASTHRATVEVMGLEEARAPRHLRVVRAA